MGDSAWLGGRVGSAPPLTCGLAFIWGRIQEDGQEYPGQSHGPLPSGLQPRAEAPPWSAEDAHELAYQQPPGDQEAADCHAKEKADSYGLLLE